MALCLRHAFRPESLKNVSKDRQAKGRRCGADLPSSPY